MPHIARGQKTSTQQFLLRKERFLRGPFVLVISMCLITCTSDQNISASRLFSSLDSTITHVNFVNHIDDTGSLNILDYLYYYNGAGVAAGDVNNDGLPDLFFVSNKGANKLFINKSNAGEIEFLDVSVEAGIQGTSDWKAGVTMADVNGDGWLDIYVCSVSNFHGLNGANALYINNGVDRDGIVKFTEKASEYGLDFKGFSTQAAFFDYDLDGDLDMYLLNHAIHTERSYDSASARLIPDSTAGDYLFENPLISKKKKIDSVRFVDVSKKAGIYQAAMGYGLGVAVTDFNNDGWDDIYVANDFHEDDYYYINNRNGTFTESIKEYFGHTSRFSMGCDAADINNDGFMDLMTVDMDPEEGKIARSSAGEDPFDIFQFKLDFGYHYQYARNCLQLNRYGNGFSDIAFMAGVSSTDWSWSPLMADYDNDGHKDIFVSNGIVRRPNDLDFIKYISSSKEHVTNKILDQKAIAIMPEGKVHNYIFKGTDGLKFDDKSAEWGFEESNISNGAIYSDLDNDGDLDIVTNNINTPASIYENNASELYHNHYLKVRLKGSKGNRFGIGAKIIVKHQGSMQVQQVASTRGFLSAVEPSASFGLGDIMVIDTVVIYWPDHRIEMMTNVKTDSVLTVHQKSVGQMSEIKELPLTASKLLFKYTAGAYGLDYTHRENDFTDFYREPLIPFDVSREGPRMATGDINGDGKMDLFVGGAKGQPGRLFVQSTGAKTFIVSEQAVFKQDLFFEDVDTEFFDADNDGDLDLYVVSGGNEVPANHPALRDRLYLNDGVGNFSKAVQSLPLMQGNKSCVVPSDMDKDGDIDLFVGGRIVTGSYGYPPRSYLLLNDGKGNFKDATNQLALGLEKVGMVTDAKWFDWGNDNDMDLLIVGHWMPVTIFENQNGKLGKIHSLENSNGFWNTVEPFDFDNDGDQDFLLGNLGTNTKFLKSNNKRVKLLVGDFDQNGNPEQIICYQEGNDWYPAATKDELSKQLPVIRKRNMTYQEFARMNIDQILNSSELDRATQLYVDRFESAYLKNEGDHFTLHTLPEDAQIAPIFAFQVGNLNGDDYVDILAGGNLLGANVYQGRYDASFGLMLTGNGKGNFTSSKSSSGFVVNGEIKDIAMLKLENDTIIIVARNNLPLVCFKLSNPE